MSQVKIVSPRAELVVLKTLCSRNAKISGAVLSQIDESYFYSEVSKELYRAIKERFSQQAVMPSLTSLMQDPEISTEAKDFIKSGRAVHAAETVAEAHTFVKTLNKYRRTRILSEINSTIATGFSESKLNIDALIEKVVTQINIAQSAKSTADCFVHLGKNDNAKDLIHDLIYGEDEGNIIPTGFAVFDKISGGFDRGGLVTLGAPSGCGKSTLAAQLCINWARMGYKVVLVPLEMSKSEMMNRILANVGNMELSKIRQKRLDDREKDLLLKRQKRFRKQVAEAGGRFTIFRPEEDLDIDEVFAAISALNCDICVIDYISLLKGIDDENQWLRLGTIARKAHVNAGTLNRLNVLLCQVSDEGKIRYSGAVKEHSSASLIWTPSEEDKQTGIYRIEQIKSRNSQPFPFSLKFISSKMQVESIDGSAEEFMEMPTDAKDQVNLASDI